jgi:dephospho-CoA kinase
MDVERNEKAEPVRKASAKRVGSLCENGSLVVGLTGGIATGKSTVAGMLADLGAEVISADDLVHRLLAEDASVRSDIVRKFGGSVLDKRGSIDRQALGRIVFENPEQRAVLEAIIHPLVLQTLKREVDAFRRKTCGVLVLEIPLLIEVGAFDLIDKVLVVTAEQETQICRLEKREAMSRDAALARIASQMPLSEKVRYGDWVVDTTGEYCATKEQIYKVWKDLEELLAHRA